MTDILGALVFFADSMFVGLRYFVPLLLLVYLILSGRRKDLPPVYLAAAVRLLQFSGLLFILTIAANTFRAWSSENEAERELMISIATGPNWHQVFFPLISYALLPFLFLWKRARHSIWSLAFVVACWYGLEMLSTYLSNLHNQGAFMKPKTDVQELLSKCLLFAGVYILFLLVQRKKPEAHKAS